MRILIRPEGRIITAYIRSDNCTIGHSPECTIVINEAGVAGKHCEIEFVNGQIFVTDLGSEKGVFLGPSRIEPYKKIPYEHAQELNLGGVIVVEIFRSQNGTRSKYSHLINERFMASQLPAELDEFEAVSDFLRLTFLINAFFLIMFLITLAVNKSM